MLHCYDLISTAIKLGNGDKICVQYSVSISGYGLITRHKYNGELDSILILGLEKTWVVSSTQHYLFICIFIMRQVSLYCIID